MRSRKEKRADDIINILRGLSQEIVGLSLCLGNKSPSVNAHLVLDNIKQSFNFHYEKIEDRIKGEF